MATPDPSTPVHSTHDWSVGVDVAHLNTIRDAPDSYAPGGLTRLVLEVLAYADEEAEDLGRRGECTVTLHDDGSVSVADNGRGTDTRRDETGAAVRKPVMSTKDLRYFDAVHGSHLPDGHARRGISVVAALSRWLVHTNRRRRGSWTQRYEYGIPTTPLTPIDDDHPSGTTVRFLVDDALVTVSATPDDIRGAAQFAWLTVEVSTET